MIDKDINPKLAHLSDEQIEALVNDYKNSDIKVSDIVRKYNISIHPTWLGRILPYEIDDHHICPYCRVNMLNKVIRISYDVPSDYYKRICRCGHVEEKNIYFECYCAGCIEKEQQVIERKRQVIRYVYGNNNEKKQFEALSVHDKINLVLFYKLKFNKSIHGWDDIQNQNRVRRIKELIDKNIISVSPESDIKAFSKEKFPLKYSLSKVDFDVNVSYGLDTGIEIFKDEYFINSCDKEEVLKEYREILAENALAQFETIVLQRRLDMHISNGAYEKFVELFGKISFAQVLYLCERVAIYYSDRIMTGKAKKYIVKNCLLSGVTRFYENSVANNWEIKNWNDYYVSDELEATLKHVVKRDASFLLEVPDFNMFDEKKHFIM